MYPILKSKIDWEWEANRAKVSTDGWREQVVGQRCDVFT